MEGNGEFFSWFLESSWDLADAKKKPRKRRLMIP